jgi:hypothetical protein
VLDRVVGEDDEHARAEREGTMETA